ncbi:MAG: hypothetical protein GKC04_07650 [Methanomicrobiales archaeon]|nr:hypothetical protein [Methanomicrobiales archaeon]
MHLRMYAACVLLVGAFLLVAGCTSESPTTITPVPTAVPATPTPAALAPEPIVIIDPALSGLQIVDLTAAVGGKSGPGIVLKYTLDARNLGGTAMSSKGYDILIYAFAYNLDDVSAGFSPTTQQDIRDANIPYASRIITIFPSNVINDQIEPQIAPLENRLLDTARPYNYGLILEVQ